MQIPSLIFTKAVTARLSWLLNVIYRIILTCCLVVVLGSVLDSGPEASSWNRSSSRLLWSGGGVSWGRLGGGPGLWAIRSVKPKPPTTRVHACNSSEGDTSVHLQWWIMGFVMSHSLIKKNKKKNQTRNFSVSSCSPDFKVTSSRCICEAVVKKSSVYTLTQTYLAVFYHLPLVVSWPIRCDWLPHWGREKEQKGSKWTTG